MSKLFEELDYCVTPMGALSLRRRTELSLGIDIYEVKLGDDFLMSSLFTASEVALARLGLESLDADGLDVAVGGLGLGYTARAALDNTSGILRRSRRATSGCRLISRACRCRLNLRRRALPF